MIRLNLLLFLFALFASPFSQADAAEDFEGTPAEEELIALLDSIDEQNKAFGQDIRELVEKPDQFMDFYTTNDPARGYVPTLLAFEERHRGTLAGLMALRRIVNLHIRWNVRDSPRVQGRREVLDRLPNYINKPELMAILSSLRYGAFEPRIESTLRAFADDENGTPLLRDYSKMALGRWMLGVRDSHQKAERRLHFLAQGISADYPKERQVLEEQLEAIPTEVLTEAWQKEAVGLLREVAESTQELFLPEVKSIDPNRHLLVVYEVPGKMRRLSDSANGVLFKENHLRLDRLAPDLEVQLLSGEKWLMGEQQDKAVIIQFSSALCGPCQRMYPDLRDLQQQYGEQLSILSVMDDRERSDAEKSVANGDITWHVHWEGRRGPISKLWAVLGRPTVYVIDQSGKIAGVRLRGEELKKKIDELLN